MLINRNNYTSRLKKLRDKNLIKVITGVRRSGKSTLFQLFQNELLGSGVDKPQIQAYNFEDPEVNKITDWRAVYDLIKSKLVIGKQNYIFLDEIQTLPEWEKLADGLFINDNVDLYVTGSNAFLLSGELATLLSGRYITTNVLPLSFAEYAEAFPTENKDRLFGRFLVSSAMPETLDLMQDSPDLVDDYLRDVYTSIVQKDIKNRYEIRDMANFEKVIKFMLDNVGNFVTAKSIADSLNANNKTHQTAISHKTIDKYLSYLTAAYLLYKVDRYDIKGKQLLKTQDKYYAVDLGFRNALLGQETDLDLGHKLENLVFLELRRRYNGQILVGRTDNKEVDFVVQDGVNRFYYQVALTVKDSQTLARELEPLQKIRDNYQKFLITTDYDNSVFEGIRKTNVIDWLLGSEL
jgi:predicted AAA+ superfamily ATPase